MKCQGRWVCRYASSLSLPKQVPYDMQDGLITVYSTSSTIWRGGAAGLLVGAGGGQQRAECRSRAGAISDLPILGGEAPDQ